MQAVKERKRNLVLLFPSFLSQIRKSFRRRGSTEIVCVVWIWRQGRVAKSQVKTDIGGSTSFPGLEIISLASMRTGGKMELSFQQCSNNKIRIVITRTSKEMRDCTTAELAKIYDTNGGDCWMRN